MNNSITAFYDPIIYSIIGHKTNYFFIFANLFSKSPFSTCYRLVFLSLANYSARD